MHYTKIHKKKILCGNDNEALAELNDYVANYIESSFI